MLLTGDLDAAARDHLAEALDIIREFGDRYGIMVQTFNLGRAQYLSGSPEPAVALFAETRGLA